MVEIEKGMDDGWSWIRSLHNDAKDSRSGHLDRSTLFIE